MPDDHEKPTVTGVSRRVVGAHRALAPPAQTAPFGVPSASRR